MTKENKIKKADLAAATFPEGFSCSQAFFSTFSESLGLSRRQALKIAQSFGGGMAHMGLTCGAVTGAFMVIGLKYGRTEAEDEEAKNKTYALVLEFVQKFKALHSSTACRELLGYDLSSEKEYQQVVEKNLFKTICPQFVRSAAEILETLL